MGRNSLTWDEAMNKVRGSLSAEVYEKKRGYWRRYSHDFGDNIAIDDVDKDDVPRRVKDLRKLTGHDIIFTNGFFEFCPVVGKKRERVVVTIGSRTPRGTAGDVGEFLGGLLKEVLR